MHTPPLTVVHTFSTFESEPHELIVVHASSTIESGAPGIDCLALFMHPRPSYSEPHEMFSVHAFSTIEFEAPRIVYLALLVNPPSSNLIRSPMN